MAVTYDISIEGHPAAQPRTRRAAQGGVYTPSVADGWRQRIAIEAIRLRPDDPWPGPITLDLAFTMPRPKGHYRANGEIKERYLDARHTFKPDLDNMVKLVKDELKQCGFYRDDAQVWTFTANKRYEIQRRLRPGLHIRMEVE